MGYFLASFLLGTAVSINKILCARRYLMAIAVGSLFDREYRLVAVSSVRPVVRFLACVQALGALLDRNMYGAPLDDGGIILSGDALNLGLGPHLQRKAMLGQTRFCLRHWCRIRLRIGPPDLLVWAANCHSDAGGKSIRGLLPR